MKLQQLRYLVEVARSNLNVSEAAEALYTSQPTVSRELARMEHLLRLTLFDRVRGRAHSQVRLAELSFAPAGAAPISAGYLPATGSPALTDAINGLPTTGLTDPLGCTPGGDATGAVAVVSRGMMSPVALPSSRASLSLSADGSSSPASPSAPSSSCSCCSCCSCGG